MQRLAPLALPLLPLIGKSPDHLGKGWQHRSFTAEQLLAHWQGKADAIGTRSGEDAHGLLICDIDGSTAIDHCQAHACDPLTAATWRIERQEAPDRLKVAWKVPKELWPVLQEAARRPGKDRPRNLICEHHTREGDKATGRKREAVEVSFGGRQMVVAGAHPDGGCYRWPEGHGPEALAEIPPAWWGLVLEVVKPRERPAPAAAAAGTPPPHRSTGPLPPRPPEAILDALAKVPPFDHGEGRRPELLGLALRLWVEVGRDEALRLLQEHSPAVRDLETKILNTEPTGLSKGSLWPFLREHYDIDISRHDLKGKRPTVEQEQAESVAGMPGGDGDDAGEPEPTATGVAALAAAMGTGWADAGNERAKRTAAASGDISRRLQFFLGDRLAFDELRLAPTLDGEILSASDLELLHVRLSELGWKASKDSTIDGVMYAARRNSFHPIRRYLLELEQDASVEALDLDTVAPRFLRATDPLHITMVRRWLVGAVARVMVPGSKMDYCLTLQSDQQGIGKSTFFETLASPDWFCCSFPEQEKDKQLAIHCTWLFELAELEAITGRRESGRIKNDLTTRVDVLRVPFGRGMERMPRASVFCATVNTREFLKDQTGNRRFWVVPIEGADRLDVADLAAARDQIWKAAVMAWRAGEVPMIDQEMEQRSEEQNSRYMIEDAWMGMLCAWINGDAMVRWDPDRDPSLASPDEPFTSAEALHSAGLKQPNQITHGDETRLGPLLRQLGFESVQLRRGGGRRMRMWRVAQPGTTSGEGGCARVVPPQTPVPDKDGQGVAQPTQPKTRFRKKNTGSVQGDTAAPAAEKNHCEEGVEVESVESPPPARPGSVAAQEAGMAQPPAQPPAVEVESGGGGLSHPLHAPAPAPAYDPFAPSVEPSAELLAELVSWQRRMPRAIANQLATAMDPDGTRGISGRMVKGMQKYIEAMADDFEEVAA